MAGSEPAIAKRPPILYFLLVIAFAASVLVSLFGIMAGMWGGSPSILAFLFWFLAVLSLPVCTCYFLFPKTAVVISWLLLIANFAALFLGIWGSEVALKANTTNPFVIALGCLYGNPSVPGLFVVAACLHLAARIEQLSKALNAQNLPALSE